MADCHEKTATMGTVANFSGSASRQGPLMLVGGTLEVVSDVRCVRWVGFILCMLFCMLLCMLLCILEAVEGELRLFEC